MIRKLDLEKLVRLKPCRQRDLAAKAAPSAAVLWKKATPQTPEGLPVHSLPTLLHEPGKRCRNTGQIVTDPSGATFHPLIEPKAAASRGRAIDRLVARPRKPR